MSRERRTPAQENSAQEKSAQEKSAQEKSGPEAAKKEPPRAEQSITQHTAMIGGSPVSFTATAGTLIVRNDKDEPWASMGYVAYVRKDAGTASRRPIAFCYNGGPGSSSIWLHMGALGPKRVVVADAAATPPPPYQIVDNAYSLLDRVDIVLIDPVGTGVSKPVGDFKNQDFWGVDPDIESVSRFIKQYVSDNGRWNSPKYLIGESYGTTRSAGVVDWLQSKGGMAFNGVVLVSNATDLGAIFAMPGGPDLPYPFFMPSYAATAWYHKVLPNPPQELEPWLTEVRKFAAGEFTAALFEGDRLSDDRRAAVVQKLHQYTGLSEEYLRLADLRVSEGEYTQQLFRQKRITVGRLDSRFVGPDGRPAREGGRGRSAIGRDLGGVHGGLPRLVQRLVEVRRGQVLRGFGGGLEDLGLPPQGPGASVPEPDPDEHGRRSRARDGREPEPARPRPERLLRPRDAVLRDRVHDGAPRSREVAPVPHRDEVLPGRPHDVRQRAVAEVDEDGHGRLRGEDVEVARRRV